MAAWQFDLILVTAGEAMLSVSESRAIQESLMTCFGSPWLMLENWLVYGTENGTRVDLLFDETDILEVSARLNVGADNEKVLDALCAMARQLDCHYLDEQAKQRLLPEKEVLLQAMMSSKAAGFVKNPNRYIDRLAAATAKPGNSQG
ncbi:hypothetical protein [Janthinobacterium sp. RB2R34]|uniref:hypothetical protein n=1 Tax=Janthinobacterium sp. RB2R34 TaxID=3424193 RepID=UPI003F279610